MWSKPPTPFLDGLEQATPDEDSDFTHVVVYRTDACYADLCPFVVWSHDYLADRLGRSVLDWTEQWEELPTEGRNREHRRESVSVKLNYPNSTVNANTMLAHHVASKTNRTAVQVNLCVFAACFFRVATSTFHSFFVN